MQPFFYMFLKYIRSMFLYNITIIAESDFASGIGNRMQEFKTQFNAQSGKNRLKSLKMMDSPHEGVTYCLQLEVGTQHEIALFQQQHLLGLQSELEQQFPGKALYFESIMEYLD